MIADALVGAGMTATVRSATYPVAVMPAPTRMRFGRCRNFATMGNCRPERRRMSPIRPLSLLLLLLTGCQTMTTQAPTPVAAPIAAADAGPGANDNLNAVVWFQSSVEYRLVAGQIWR